jgi:acetolactate synthase-1/2/3 large subunit
MAQVIGALNLAAGLRDAWLAHSPVIAMTGGREPQTKFRKVYQEVDDLPADDLPAFEPVTKFNATVDDVARFPDMRQAFRVATSGTAGPVHLQFRGNEGQIDADEAELEVLCEPQFARLPPFRPQPEQVTVLAALGYLQNAERPVIVAGGGVRASLAAAELIAFAEALQIPVATSLNGKDSIPGTHACAPALRAPIRARAQTAWSTARGPSLLHRNRNRGNDDPFLVGAEDRYAGHSDRYQSGSHRAQLPAARRHPRRCQGYPGSDAQIR